ncbi:MAG: ABC transporter C-terminal domain-containing protein [Monoglobales bacterium]
MTEDGLESYNGGYDYFLEHRRTETVEKEKKEIPKNIEYKEHKRLAAEKRKIINRFKKVEENISSLEDEIEAKNKLFENPEIATDFVKANDLQKEIDTLESELEKYFSEWEELQALIDENGYEV